MPVATRAFAAPARPVAQLERKPPPRGEPASPASIDALRLHRGSPGRASCACGGICPRCASNFPTKLTVGPAGDAYEQEAERVAAQVMGEAPSPRQDPLIANPREAARYVPPQHAPLIKSVLYYPGADPGGFAAADADRANYRIRVFEWKTVTAETFVHDVGHLVSFQAEQQDSGSWTKWEEAMRADAVALSRYGMRSRDEDFAEAYYLYRAAGPRDPANRKRYGHRFAILDQLY